MSKATETAQYNIGGALSRFANIERMIQEYLAYGIYSHNKADGDKIYSDIFSHKFFSFDFKKALLLINLKHSAPNIYAQFPTTALNRAQELRNVIAHGGLTVPRKELFDSYDDLEITHGVKTYNFQKTLDEFLKNANSVLTALLELKGISKELVDEKSQSLTKEI